MTLPLPEQLEKALMALRKYIVAEKVTRAQVEKMKKVRYSFLACMVSRHADTLTLIPRLTID